MFQKKNYFTFLSLCYRKYVNLHVFKRRIKIYVGSYYFYCLLKLHTIGM
jgi:hypothetical protein